MENVDVAVSMPDRQLKGLSNQMDEDEDIDQETVVKMFSLDSVADQVFNRKKKIAGEFDGDADDEEDNNPLAVLEGEVDEEIEINSENMEDWLKKLHIRTQHLVGKVTVNGMSRLAATNHVATALTRFKGKVRVDSTGKRVASDENSNGLDTDEGQSAAESPETPTPPTEIPKDVNSQKKNPSTKESAVRSKKVSKQSSKTEAKTPRRNRETSQIHSGTKAAASSEMRKTINKTHPPSGAGLPAPVRTVVDVANRKTNNKVKPAVKSVRSGIKSKVIH